MGQILAMVMGEDDSAGDVAVKRQAEGASNPMYQLANLMGAGLLVELSKKAMLTGSYKELDDAIRLKIPKYLYNGGKVGGGKFSKYIYLYC